VGDTMASEFLVYKKAKFFGVVSTDSGIRIYYSMTSPTLAKETPGLQILMAEYIASLVT
jgi:hypothetical protein